MDALPADWPTTSSVEACRQWLGRVWAEETFVTPLCAASPGLTWYVERILRGDDVQPKRIRKVTNSVAAYLLRATGRSTPFGLFAGVALAGVGPTAATLGTAHQPVARPDTLWVDHVRRDLQVRADVLLRQSLHHTGVVRRENRLCPPSVLHGDSPHTVTTEERSV
ncbi:lantibiotic dehydratase [Streptomyces viridochromogenes]|uniref:lantibiotic dehydratase n=1 Tax=Streptomyces viridochromogenes TaxID=1938 RepID=UPI001AD7FCC0